MIVASFVGQKGGVGKSALARVLAVAAARNGRKVLSGDYDLEQLSCVEWGATRLKNGIEPEVEVRPFKRMKKLRKTSDGFDLVGDARGLADELTEQISAESNVIFLPKETSLDDLRPTIRLAERLSRQGENGDKIILVLPKTGRSERMVKHAQAHIDNAGFECLDAMWPQREVFKPNSTPAAPAAKPVIRFLSSLLWMSRR